MLPVVAASSGIWTDTVGLAFTFLVLMPALARISHDEKRFRAAVLRALHWICIVACPLSLRATSDAQVKEILDAWFASGPSDEDDDRANVAHVDEIT